MMKLNFKRSKYDACLYMKDLKRSEPLYVLLYVNDLLLICKTKRKIVDLKRDLNSNFDTKDLGPAQKNYGD